MSLENTLQDEISLLNAFGWEEGYSKNAYMKSFFREGHRLNFYFTTMTVTVQSDNGKCQTYRDVDLKQLEDIIEEFK